MKKNNFIDNEKHADFMCYGLPPTFTLWWHNYWDDWKGKGRYRIEGRNMIIYIIIRDNWFQFDRNPAQEPYDI